MLSAKHADTASLLSPFEAGSVDNSGLNQTCCAIADRGDVFTAVRLEKTASWLLNGETVLEVKIRKETDRECRPASEEDRRKISRNPLWMRELELA